MRISHFLYFISEIFFFISDEKVLFYQVRVSGVVQRGARMPGSQLQLCGQLGILSYQCLNKMQLLEF